MLQCLLGEQADAVKRIILTASGGPFRGWTAERLAFVTPAEALRHPTWSMGRRITVDSATLINKGLEVIEAQVLFGIGYDRIDVVVHPESIVHSMVEFADGSVKAQMGEPDMKVTHPIRPDPSRAARRRPLLRSTSPGGASPSSVPTMKHSPPWALPTRRADVAARPRPPSTRRTKWLSLPSSRAGSGSWGSPPWWSGLSTEWIGPDRPASRRSSPSTGSRGRWRPSWWELVDRAVRPIARPLCTSHSRR